MRGLQLLAHRLRRVPCISGRRHETFPPCSRADCEFAVGTPTKSAAQAFQARWVRYESRLQAWPSLERLTRRRYIGMRKLKIIRSQHKNDERQRRVNLNALRQTSKSLSPRFEWVIPYGTPAVQTIFNQSQPVAGGVELVL